MFDKDLLSILVCPETHQPLTEAADEVLRRVNARISAGEIQNRAGKPVCEPMQGGLVRQDGKVLYPIRDEIPMLTVDEGIALAADVPAPLSSTR